MNTIVAVDIGASSGRLMLAWLEDGQMKLSELHRFKNSMQKIDGHHKWDIDYLFNEIMDGLQKIKTTTAIPEDLKPISIGIDTWAIDYVLLDSTGKKTADVYAYRDHRTDETMEKVFAEVDKEVIYKKTGIQFLQFNSIYQLFEHVRNNSEDFDEATDFLMVPDYLNYRLSNVKAIEYTNATASQLLNIDTNDWDGELLDILGVPKAIMSKPVEAGTILGTLSEECQKLTGLPAIKVITTATHDTASAVAAVPAIDENFAYISSGTWSLMGVENDKPITSDAAMAYNFTNEGGVYGTYRYLKNIMGLWLIQEATRLYKGLYSFGELVDLAGESEEFRSLINPNDSRFLNPENMIEEIKAFCEETNQPIPMNPGQIARCIFESLAFLYKDVLEQLKETTDKKIDRIHIIGGGCQNQMLNQMCADFTDCEVMAGPIEATAIGNIAVQMISLGMVKDLAEARDIIRDSFGVVRYQPIKNNKIETMYNKFKQLGGL